MTTRFLKEDEYLLVKQQIKGIQKVNKQTLARYYQQQPNSRWLGVPFLLWLYQTGQRSFNKEAIQQRTVQIETKFDAQITAAAADERAVKRLHQKRNKKLKRREEIFQKGNLLMRYGEPPVLYSPQRQVATEQFLLGYLHTKGYFNAQVSSAVQLHDKKAIVTYQVEENKPYVLAELRLNTPDKAIEKLIQDHQQQSLLKQGDHYDQEVLNQERERIYELLSNHGYFGFDKQYIRFDVDSTAIDNAVVVETVIGIPTDSQAHPVFHIDQVEWHIDVAQSEQVTQSQELYCSGIIFKNLSHQFKPSVLVNKLAFSPLQLYRRQDLIETQRRLYRLDMFKSIYINCDIAGNSKLVSHIHATPADRFQLSNELGLQIGPWWPKPFYKLSLKGRNLLKRLEVLELATHVGVEGIAVTTSRQGFSSSQACAVALSLSWPQFLLLCKATTHTYWEQLRPTTKLLFDYKYTWHPDYKQDTFESLIRYDWQDQGQGVYEFTPLRIELTNTKDKADAFEDYLKDLRDQGNNLYRTFNPSWISLLSFKSSFCKQPMPDEEGSYSLLEMFLESGGTLQNFMDLRKLMPKLEYYQYVKFNVAHSQHIPLRDSTLFAYRIQVGVAKPYGEYNILPYDRYYFLGGGNDMRAWYPRTLGPGTYNPPKRDQDTDSMGHTGELLLQASVELRQHIMGFLEGALFVDAGNIWTLREDNRAGGKFSFQNFYKEIAVGTGMGLRLNFKLLVLRLDVGFKLYDPARPLGERLMKHQFFSNKPVWNIGIDYPF